MIKRIFVIVLYLAFSSAAFTQSKDPVINILKKSHDFGEIKEAKGIVKYRFTFINKGGAPVLIKNVKTSCGCTTSNYSKIPVLPGEMGFFDISFDPANRPGPFNKRITLYTNAINNPTNVNIKGVVIGEKQESILNPKTTAEKYRFNVGPLKVSTNHVAFNKVDFRKVETKSMLVYNPQKMPVSLSFEKIPRHIGIQVISKDKSVDVNGEVKDYPKILMPGEEAEVIITYDAVAKDDWGFLFDRLTYKINDEVIDNTKLSVSANIVETFEELSEEEKEQAPRIEFKTKTHSFDTIYEGDIVSYKYNFVNKGKSPLILRKVKASCGCTTPSIGSKIIKPGQSSYVVAEFDSKGRGGKQSKTVTVTTNDPLNTTAVLRLDVYVKQSEK